ncbi:recombinase family protein [Streptomyces sp. NPDC057137]|uniref:recombinase family protein n=1 Tax=Streptomyces sp. NPDC057137 TaxID=3346030 RepID=UPI003635A9A9
MLAKKALDVLCAGTDVRQGLVVEKQRLLLSIDAVLQRGSPGQLRAVAYLRVSTEEQKKGYGITYSGKRVVKHIAEKGWALVDVFADEGFSGSLDHTRRPDLKRLMEIAEQEPSTFDLVCVYEERVIGRRDKAFWPWVWKLEDDHCIFTAVVKGDYDNTTDEGRSKMRKAQDRAEDELVTIRDRTQGGIQEKAEDGGYTGGNVPFGWRIEHQGMRGKSCLVLDDGEGGEWHALAEGRRLAVKHRGDWLEVALGLNALDLYTRSGVAWSRQNARSRIMSPAVLNAEVVFRGTAAERAVSRRGARTGRDGKPLYGETVVIAIPPAFEPAEIQELKEVVRPGKAGRSKAAAPQVYPLSGNFFGLCGGHYVGQKQSRSGERWYNCSGKDGRAPGAPVCQCRGIPSDRVETELWRALVGVLSHPKKLKKSATGHLEMTADQRASFAYRIGALDEQIEAQGRAVRATMAVAAKLAAFEGKDDREIEREVEAVAVPLMREKAGLERLRAEVVHWQQDVDAALGRVRDLEALSDAVRQRLYQLSLAEQVEVVNLLNLTVRVTKAPPQVPKGAGCPVRNWFEERSLKVPARVSEEAWQRIEPVVSAGDRPWRTGRRFDHREALEGILHKARAGITWREVPLSQGTGKGLSSRFRRWRESGTFDKVMEFLAAEESVGLPPAREAVLPKMEVEGTFVLHELLGSLTAYDLSTGILAPHVIRFRCLLGA